MGQRDIVLITCVILTLGILGLGCTSQQNHSAPTQTPIIVILPGDDGTQNSTVAIRGSFPTPLTCEAGAIEQSFQNGRMFWVGRSFEERCSLFHTFAPETGEIWVAIFDAQQNGGTWFSFVDSWDGQSDIPFDLTMTEPAGLMQPVRGFGRVWREELTADQRSFLGWATGPELAYIATYRYDPGGTLADDATYIPGPGQNVLTSMIGERFYLDEQTWLFDYIPAPEE